MARTIAADYGATVLPFAGALKSLVGTLLAQLGWSGSRIADAMAGDKSDEVYNGVTLRHVLQTLGTDWGRAVLGRNVWVECWMRQADLLADHDIIADDVRFLNEAAVIRLLGGQVWMVQRPSAGGPACAHGSEGGMAGYDFDKTLHNTSDLATLQAQARAYWTDI